MNYLKDMFVDLLSPIIRPVSPGIRPAGNGANKGVSPHSPNLPGDDVKIRSPASSATETDGGSIPDDCIGALREPEGGLYLPWGPHLPPDDVCTMRAELIAIIEVLSALECWASAYRDDVLTRAIRGPLADLLPNISYFRERLEAARAATSARAALKMRSWRFEDLGDRSCCDSCDGSCFGTAKRCGKLRN